MRFTHSCLCIILIFPGWLLLSSTVSAQEKNRISGDFDGLPFVQFVHEIESRTNFHFFYDLSQVDSLTVTLHVKEKPIQAVLDQALLNSGFHYAVDGDNQVFIVKRYEIQTRLPVSFFEHRANPTDSVLDFAKLLADNGEDKEKEKLKSSLENKLFDIGAKTNAIRQGNSTLAGYVRDAKSGEALIGAAVYIDNPPIGVTTDQFGYYSFTLPRGRHALRISSVGMKDTKRQIMLYSDGKLNIELHDLISSLKTIVVVAEKNSNVKRLQMGVERLNIKAIRQMPVVFGESDIIKAILSLPGVTSVGEASAGFNVRGGAADQNLILFNGTTVYNPSHLFGFFTAFNPDVVKDVELYKSSIPEKYGGRLSSVLDVTTRDGNKKKISGIGGIGPITGRLTLEGPIIKDKTSFLIGGRTSYSDWLLKALPNPDYKNSSASFYDVDLHINHEINAKNNIYLTGYLSKDQFRLNSDTLYKYSNRNVNLKWKHIFNNKFNAVISVGYDSYQYSISSKFNPVNAYQLAFDINQTNFRSDFAYTLSSKHTLDFGINSIYYKLHPGSFTPEGTHSLVAPDIVPPEQGLESAAYLGDHFEITPRLSLNAGLRYSMFNYLGRHDIYDYLPGSPREVTNIKDTVSYKSGAFIKTYQGVEYRLSARYSLSDNSSVKISYNTLRQYIHMLSNTTAISPTDIWKLSDPNIKPQLGDQFSIGFYKNFKSNTIETSLEVYYKHLKDYLDYKSGAMLVLNHHIETDVLNTRGKSYGIEFSLKKTEGKLNGWLSYTYSRTLLQTDDPLAGQKVNQGDYYPADFDKPHNVNFIGNYKFSHRFSISLNLIYSTGRPITLPVALYNLGGSERVYYSERNQYRVPDYFRSDFSMNIEGNHKVKKLSHNFWTLGVYNLTARKNPYSIYFVEENGLIKGYKLSIFGTAIPFITYNFRF
jgi:hypothetical protein